MDEASLLLGVAPEIRVLIYQYLFNLDLWGIIRQAGCHSGGYTDAAGCCDLYLNDGQIYVKKRWSPIAFRDFSAILRTCRLINTEATPVLYDQTTFYIRISDEQYNRTMRLYAPLHQCAFLPRVQQIKISPDVRTHEMLIRLPAALEDLVDQLACGPSSIHVDISVNSGALSAFPPTSIIPIGPMMEDARWLSFLERMSNLSSRVTFRMSNLRVRNSIQGRLDQLIQAVER